MPYPVYIRNLTIGSVPLDDIGIVILPAPDDVELFDKADDIQVLQGSRDLLASLLAGDVEFSTDGIDSVPLADADNFLRMALIPTSNAPYSAIGRNAAGEVDEDVSFDGTAVINNPVLGTNLDTDGYDVEGLPNPPGSGNSAASMDYVLSVAHGLRPKEAVEVLSDAAIAVLSGPKTIDGVGVVADDRVLLINQNGVDPPTAHANNGIWVVKAGAWVRPDDFPTGGSAAAVYVFVKRGTKYADTGWLCMNDTGSDVIDTNPLLWTQFSGPGSQKRSIPFGISLGVPSAGTRYLHCSEVPGSSAALRMMRNGTVTGFSVQVDSVDAKEYEVYLEIRNGATGVPVSSTLIASFKNVLGAHTIALDEEYTAGQALDLIVSKKAGEPAGASVFSNIVALLEITE